MPQFEALARQSRRERAPEVDVRETVWCLIRAAPQVEGANSAVAREQGWKELLIEFFSLPTIQVTAVVWLVAVLLAFTLGSPTAEPQTIDPITRFLLAGG